MKMENKNKKIKLSAIDFRINDLSCNISLCVVKKFSILSKGTGVKSVANITRTLGELKHNDGKRALKIE